MLIITILERKYNIASKFSTNYILNAFFALVFGRHPFDQGHSYVTFAIKPAPVLKTMLAKTCCTKRHGDLKSSFSNARMPFHLDDTKMLCQSCCWVWLCWRSSARWSRYGSFTHLLLQQIYWILLNVIIREVAVKWLF